ncbi:MAG: lipopolysaccharide assembly protein LapA domain-containing protein [Gammaproteobacteria bacterium]|nr:lipopolysaccharide assembly protein LapA domain-containing protein [Gammaproteobacteria bacterium]
MRKAYRMVRNVALAIVLLAVVTVAVILGIDNQAPMTVRFLNQVSPEWPAFWWLCAAFGCGLLLGVLLCAASLVRSRLSQRMLRRSLRQREPSAGEREGLAPRMKEPEIDRLSDLPPE